MPRFHQRAFAHNYYAPFIYHIIFEKQDAAPMFGSIRGDARIRPGNPGSADIEKSDLGRIIARTIRLMGSVYPILQIYQYMVMPDHVHLLLRVKEWSDKHLDYYMDATVSRIAANYSQHVGRAINASEIFHPGYCDKPLLRGRNLNSLFEYIRQNPHRLAIRRQYPQFFQRVNKFKIGDREYEAYGNLFLYRNPDKLAVKISRNFTSEEKNRKKDEWLSEASKGTILVSPFISKDDKAIRTSAETLGGKIILINHEAFPERFKPAAHDFELCSQGRLLIISLGLPPKTPLTRNLRMQMNKLAEEISSL